MSDTPGPLGTPQPPSESSPAPEALASPTPAAVPRADTAALAADVVSQAGTAAPTPEVADVSAESALPGAHRGGFARLPTEPVGIAGPWAPSEHAGGVAEAQWLAPAPAAPRRALAGWSLAVSSVGLVVSLFVGWGFPIGIVGIVGAGLALRSPRESRGVAGWALALGILSVLYSAGWLLFAASRAVLFG